jgi:CrcB protein
VFYKILLVMIGGGLGAVSRYLITLLSSRLYGSGFPWGTLFVNLSGCFLIGVSFALAEYRNILSPSARLFIMTGFLGGLTTFSTYALESVNFARSGDSSVSVINFILNNFIGMALVIVGMWIVKSIL